MTSSAALIGAIAAPASPSAGLLSPADATEPPMLSSASRHHSSFLLQKQTKRKNKRRHPTMALRNPYALPLRMLSSSFHSAVRPTARVFSCQWNQKHGLATATSAPAKGSKGPTAMVFLNMGGPSKTDDVEDFLSRLFVCPIGV